MTSRRFDPITSRRHLSGTTGSDANTQPTFTAAPRQIPDDSKRKRRTLQIGYSIFGISPLTLIGLLVGFLIVMALVNPLIQRNLEETNHPFGWVPTAKERRRLRRKIAQDGGIGKETSRRQVEEIWEWTDENSNGSLSVGELTRLVWMTSRADDNPYAPSEVEHLIKYFGSLHPEFKESNTMSHASFTKQYEMEGPEQANHDHTIIHSVKLDKLFKFADGDKDGTLSAEEVRNYIRATEGFGDHDPRTTQAQDYLVKDLQKTNPNLTVDGSMTRDAVMKHYSMMHDQLDHDYEVVFNNAVPDTVKDDIAIVTKSA